MDPGMTLASEWPNLEKARAALTQGTGHGIKVAVLDSGIETGHPLLKGLQLADDLAVTDDGFRISTVAGKGHDVFGHGSAIAQIIRTVAPEAQIGSFRVLSEQ